MSDLEREARSVHGFSASTNLPDSADLFGRIEELEATLADAEQWIEELREAGQTLANIAASAVCEPRRFYENEDDHQHALGLAVAQFRRAALEKSAERERE